MDELCRSFSPDCFSLDDILASSEKVTCLFTETVRHLGFLDVSAGGGDSEDDAHPGAISGGTRLELPLWLAVFLGELNQRRVARVVAPPSIYRAHQRSQLMADATVVPLASRAPYFYLTGLHVLRAPLPDAAAIARCLVETLRARLRPIMDAAAVGEAVEDQPFCSRLDQLERSLLAVGRQSTRAHQRWMNRQHEQITTDQNVLSHRKRKSAAVDT